MKKILIVDDQPEVCRLLQVVLRAEGREILYAETGEEGLKLARRQLPDLILLDVMMPGGMDGYEVARRLKADPATAACPVIAMTAKVQTQDRDNAFAAGADDYLRKPFDMVDLKKRVGSYLRDD